jgi:hypothetical protein
MSGSKILTLIEDVIHQGVQAGTFQEQDATKFSFLFFGSLHGIMQLKKLERTAMKGENHQALFEYSVQKLIQGLTP